MREILFRAKSAVTSEWVYGYLMPFDNVTGWAIVTSKTVLVPEYATVGSGYFIEVLNDTICQYTGLKDKNGNRIFEGDIVKTEHGRICRVDYRILSGFVGFDLTPLEYTNKYPSADTLWRKENIEVIGNVYDNPERLEKE